MVTSVHQYRDDGGEWNAFVNNHADSTNYHRYGWRKVIEQSFGHKTCYLVARNSSGAICGVLPLTHMKSRLFGNFLVSLPFFNYGGLLCTDDTVAASLLNTSRSMLEGNGAGHLELRHLKKYGEGLATRQHKVAMILNLECDEVAQWQMLDAKVRNQVRKAEKNGVRTVVGGVELLDDFYRVFARNMRDLGTPVYGREFFRSLLNEFATSTKVFAVTLDNRTIAAGIASWFKGTLEVPWASSISDYRPLCPNNLLYWDVIRFAIGQGFGRLDFGRSTPGEGTYNFKKQWGAVPVPLYWQYQLEPNGTLPELNPRNPKYGKAIRIWQKLPLCVTNLLGPHVVRNIP